MKAIAAGAVLLFAGAAVAHEFKVTIDEAEIRDQARRATVVEPLRLRVVVEPSSECTALLEGFTKAMKNYAARDTWVHAVRVINIAQEAVHKGCWR